MTGRFFVLALMISVVAACTSVPEGSRAPGEPPESVLAGAVKVASVTGDRTSNPAWKSDMKASEVKSSLEDALAQQGMLAASRETFQLAVALVELKEPPLGGLTMKVNTTITYTITSSGRLISEETINASGEAGVEDSLLGFERLKLAKERSVDQNIKIYVDLLESEAATNPAFQGDLNVSMWQGLRGG